MLFSGYRNRRGEIDGLLLGPSGLFAYEVKYLTHERARVGSSRNPTVQVETSVQGLLRLTGQSPATLSTKQRTEIGQIIRDDHHHHEQRRSAPRPGRA